MKEETKDRVVVVVPSERGSLPSNPLVEGPSKKKVDSPLTVTTYTSQIVGESLIDPL